MTAAIPFNIMQKIVWKASKKGTITGPGFGGRWKKGTRQKRPLIINRSRMAAASLGKIGNDLAARFWAPSQLIEKKSLFILEAGADLEAWWILAGDASVNRTVGAVCSGQIADAHQEFPNHFASGKAERLPKHCDPVLGQLRMK